MLKESHNVLLTGEQWRTEGGLEPNSKFRGLFISKNLIGIQT
jgi:hypothetical protein